MTVEAGPNIVNDGLILNLDPDNTKSYPGTGSSITNMIDGTSQTLNGTFSKSSLGIRLTNTNASNIQSNVSRLNINTYASIRTIGVWVNIINVVNGYVLDSRSGSGIGYIWSSGIGTDWPNMSINGQDKIASNITDSFSTGAWKFLTYESAANFTDDVTMFARFSNAEGMDCTFGEILFYNRVLTNSEINQNFNALRGRYGI